MSKLKPCTDCKREISVNAKSCPNCGAPPPREEMNWLVGFIFSCIVFGFFIVDYTSSEEASPARPEDNKTHKTPCAKDYKLCKDNLDILDNSGAWPEASAKCKRAAKENAISKIDWGGMLELNFTYTDSTDSGVKDGVIIIADKVAMYENEFGGKVKKTTICTYNLETKEVENIETRERFSN